MAHLRFLTDENISPRIVYAIRQAGYDVIDVKEAKRFGWSDVRVLAWATAEGRVVITHDKDFAGLLRNPMSRRHAGVILVQLLNQHATHVIAKILPVIVQLRSRRLRNALVIIGEESVECLRG